MTERKIKNLLLDLGGVIMDIKRDNCVRAFEALGMSSADDLLGEYAQKGAFLALEEGALSPELFREEIRKNISVKVSDQDIDEAFCKFLLGIPPHRLNALDELRKQYKLYLLSNTNPIMIESDIKRYFRVCGKEMEDYFDGMVLSYEAKAVKPDLRIFEYAVSHLGIVPQETLFLDDSQKNLDAASLSGFNVALVSPNTEFTDVLEKCL